MHLRLRLRNLRAGLQRHRISPHRVIEALEFVYTQSGIIERQAVWQSVSYFHRDAHATRIGQLLEALSEYDIGSCKRAVSDHNLTQAEANA